MSDEIDLTRDITIELEITWEKEDLLKIMGDFRKKYEELGLTDEQIYVAVSSGISLEQLLKMKGLYDVATEEFHKRDIKTFDDFLNMIVVTAMESPFETLRTQLKQISEIVVREEEATVRRNKKGKTIKPWEKNKYFD